MDSNKDCVFCKIIKREIPSNIVFENEDVVAFPDINPKAKVHILIVPKEHRTGLTGLKKEDISLAGKLMLSVQEIARKMKLDSFRVIINSGPAAGQTVFHLHLHLLSPEGFIH